MSAHFIEEKTEAAAPGSRTSGTLLFPSWEIRIIKRICKGTAAETVENIELGLYSFTDEEDKTGTHLMISFSDTVRVG